MLKTEPLFTFEDTKHPDLKRFTDREGNWEYYWDVKKKKLYPAVTYVTDIAVNKGIGFVQFLLSVSKEEARKILAESGDEGSRVHNAIANLLSGNMVKYGELYQSRVTGKLEALNEDEWQALLSWEAWVREFSPKSFLWEESLWIDGQAPCAGTFDFYGPLELSSDVKVLTWTKDKGLHKKAFKGKLARVLCDWKKTSGVYKTHYLQLAIYFKALIKRAKELGLPAPTHAAVVRLGTKHKNGGYEMIVMDRKAINYYARKFVYAYKLEEEQFLTELPEIEEIPVELKVKVPQIKSLKEK